MTNVWDVIEDRVYQRQNTGFFRPLSDPGDASTHVLIMASISTSFVCFYSPFTGEEGSKTACVLNALIRSLVFEQRCFLWNWRP